MPAGDHWEGVRSALARHITDARVQELLGQIRRCLTDEFLQRGDVLRAPIPGQGPAVPNDSTLLHTLIDITRRKAELRKQLLETRETGMFHFIGTLHRLAQTAEEQLLRLAAEFREQAPAPDEAPSQRVSAQRSLAEMPEYSRSSHTSAGPTHERHYGAIYYVDFPERPVIPAKEPEPPKPLPFWTRAKEVPPMEAHEAIPESVRHARLSAWALDDRNPIPELQRKVMSRFWHVAQAVTNRMHEILPLDRVKIEMADANLAGLLAIREAAASIDPAQPGGFEARVIPCIQRAIIRLIAERGFPQTAKRIEEQHECDEEALLLAARARRYGETAAEVLEGAPAGAGAVSEKLLKDCSMQERIIVLLHARDGKSFGEIGETIGLPAPQVQEIFQNVKAGRKGGRSAAPPPRAKAPPAEKKGEKMEHDRPRAIHSFEGMPVRVFSHEDRILDLDLRFGNAGEKSFPGWLTELSENHATQLRSLLSGLRSQTDADWLLARRHIRNFFEGIQHPILQQKANFRKLLHSVSREPRVWSGRIAEWIQNPNPVGSLHIPAKFSRSIEVGMEAPNIRRIIERHFGDRIPVYQRRLLDIGSSDGDLTERVAQDLFGQVIAVEPECERFRQLETRAVTLPGWHLLNMDVQALMDSDFREQPDAILLSHVLHFLQKEQREEEALAWAIQRMKSKGLLLTVLNDTMPHPGSRAHFLQELGAQRNRNRPPREYAEFLLGKECALTVCQPTLRYRAKGQKGIGALRQIMRGMIPEELPHREERLQHYMERHVLHRTGDGTAEFNHTMTILVARHS